MTILMGPSAGMSNRVSRTGIELSYDKLRVSTSSMAELRILQYYLIVNGITANLVVWLVCQEVYKVVPVG